MSLQVFSVSWDFCVLNHSILFWSALLLRLSPIHGWIIPSKSPKSLILFISTPHKKGALFPLLSLAVSRPGFPTSVRTRTSCGDILNRVWFEGIPIYLDRAAKTRQQGALHSGSFWGGFAQSTECHLATSHVKILITVQRTCIEIVDGHIFQSERRANPDLCQ